MPAVKLNAYITALLSEVQTAEDAALATLIGRYLDNAIGVQLDGLGDLVGEERLGRSDDDYRNAIRVRIFQNQSSGTPEEMLTLLRLLVQDATGIHIEEIFPAKVWFEMATGTQPANFQALMQQAAPAGVGVRALAPGEFGFRMGRDRMADRL
jgi:hypothetical protein